MLGRQVTAALRRPLQARLRTATSVHPEVSLCIRTFSHAPRQLSPVGRPKKAVGEPSKPIKRAVKSTSKKPASKDTDAAAKKLAQKKKLAEKKAAAAAKAKAKRTLTPEQLEKKKAAAKKAENKELKKAALDPPNVPVASAYHVFIKEQSGKLKEQSANGNQKAAIAEFGKTVSAAWRSLSPGELEHYNHVAHTAKDNGLAEYKRWVESHSVEEITIANTARRTLRRRFPSEKGTQKKWVAIQDERLVKKAVSPWVQFMVTRLSSPDFKHIVVNERMKLISQEWKALDESEKQKYKDLSSQDADRYASEYNSVFGHSPTQAQAAASAVA